MHVNTLIGCSTQVDKLQLLLHVVNFEGIDVLKGLFVCMEYKGIHCQVTNALHTRMEY